MIYISDTCDPPVLTPHDHEIMVCFARIILECIISRPHSMTVDISVKSRSESIYRGTKTGGFFWVEDDKKRDYQIVLFADSNTTRKDLGEALVHELIHVKQHLEDGFRIDLDAGFVYWNDTKYMRTKDLVGAIKEGKDDLYSEFPWEFEANSLIPAVLTGIQDRLFGIIENEGMANYLDMCYKDKNYEPNSGVY